MSEFFTVGHSDHSLEDFLRMLREAGADTVVDVRRLPGSRKYPWFDQDPLAASLEETGIGYRHVPALTGRRPRQPDVDPEVNGFWENRSFHHYADYALSQEFREGLEQVRGEGGERPALMCAEAVWWRCHRRIIADHLLGLGETVRHIMGPGKTTEAQLTRGALVHEDGQVTYPQEGPADDDAVGD